MTASAPEAQYPRSIPSLCNPRVAYHLCAFVLLARETHSSRCACPDRNMAFIMRIACRVMENQWSAKASGVFIMKSRHTPGRCCTYPATASGFPSFDLKTHLGPIVFQAPTAAPSALYLSPVRLSSWSLSSCGARSATIRKSSRNGLLYAFTIIGLSLCYGVKLYRLPAPRLVRLPRKDDAVAYCAERHRDRLAGQSVGPGQFVRRRHRERRGETGVVAEGREIGFVPSELHRHVARAGEIEAD